MTAFEAQPRESERWSGQSFFDLDIEGGNHIAHDAVKAAKRDQFDDTGVAVREVGFVGRQGLRGILASFVARASSEPSRARST